MPAAPSYIAVLSDGSRIEIPGATKSKKDGSGTYFYDANGEQIANFYDGVVTASYPATAIVTPPPSPEEPPAE